MRGLLLKEWYMMAAYCKLILLISCIFLGISFVSEENLFFLIYPSLLCGVIPASLLAYDERSKWDQYSAVLPYTKAQIVSGKYLIGLFAQMGILLLSTLVQALRMGSDLRWAELGSLIGLLAVLTLLLPAISLPPMFRWGVEKGRMGYYFMVGLLTALAFVGMNLTENHLLEFLARLPLAIAVLAAAGVYGLSWWLSIRFCEKKAA